MTLSEQYTLPIRIGGAGPVHVISGTMANGTDNTIFTPTDPSHSVFLVGQFFAETSATNPTYKSGTTAIVTPELAANQVVNDKMPSGVILGTAAGQALAINPSADISSAVFHVIEAKALVF